MKKKYSTCNFDDKELHPDDKKAIEEFIEYRKRRAEKICKHLLTKTIYGWSGFPSIICKSCGKQLTN